MADNRDFDLFRTSEDHEELRDAVRAVAENKIAPYAAEVDASSAGSRIEAYDALVASDFHAPHVPEEYDGVGADALATCIVIEEIARVCASSSLIPAVNKLGSLPLILGGSDELKRKYLTPLAAGRSGFSYGLSEREAGSDTASMKMPGQRRRRRLGPQRRRSRGSPTPGSPTSTPSSRSPTPMAGAAATSAPSSWRSRTRASPSARRRRSSASRARPPAS